MPSCMYTSYSSLSKDKDALTAPVALKSALYSVDEILDLTRQGKFYDTPMQPVHWNIGTKQQELVDAVQGTLEGYRSGKGIFVFGET